MQILGYKFRRQHPVREFIVDFFCAEKELVIEIDGKIHQLPDVSEKDENRTAELESLGLTVIRFTNEEVMHNTDHVVRQIMQVLISPSPLERGPGGEAEQRGGCRRRVNNGKGPGGEAEQREGAGG